MGKDNSYHLNALSRLTCGQAAKPVEYRKPPNLFMIHPCFRETKFFQQSNGRVWLAPRVRHTVEQVLATLREAEVALRKRQSVAHVCRALSITEQTYQ